MYSVLFACVIRVACPWMYMYLCTLSNCDVVITISCYQSRVLKISEIYRTVVSVVLQPLLLLVPYPYSGLICWYMYDSMTVAHMFWFVPFSILISGKGDWRTGSTGKDCERLGWQVSLKIYKPWQNNNNKAKKQTNKKRQLEHAIIGEGVTKSCILWHSNTLRAISYWE